MSRILPKVAFVAAMASTSIFAAVPAGEQDNQIMTGVDQPQTCEATKTDLKSNPSFIELKEKNKDLEQDIIDLKNNISKIRYEVLSDNLKGILPAFIALFGVFGVSTYFLVQSRLDKRVRNFEKIINETSSEHEKKIVDHELRIKSHQTIMAKHEEQSKARDKKLRQELNKTMKGFNILTQRIIKTNKKRFEDVYMRSIVDVFSMSASFNLYRFRQISTNGFTSHGDLNYVCALAEKAYDESRRLEETFVDRRRSQEVMETEELRIYLDFDRKLIDRSLNLYVFYLSARGLGDDHKNVKNVLGDLEQRITELNNEENKLDYIDLKSTLIWAELHIGKIGSKVAEREILELFKECDEQAIGKIKENFNVYNRRFEDNSIFIGGLVPKKYRLPSP